MIKLYSGTPGSGKSLHCARDIYLNLKYGNYVYLCNFPMNFEKLKEEQQARFHYVPNSKLSPKFLEDFSKEYFKANPCSVKKKEGKIKVYIDEAQMMFNAREWQATYKQGWNTFFSLHRHLGYDIILITQFDRSLDRQVRSLLEYEFIHRNVSNVGANGKFFALLCGGSLFCCVKKWYPMKEKVGSEFFRFSKKLNGLYDTHSLFLDEK